MSRCLLAVVVQTLRSGRVSPTLRVIFNRAIECTRALLEFYMYSYYKSHDEDTVSYMDDAPHRFHRTKDVFLGGRIGKRARAKASKLRTELVRKRRSSRQTTWQPLRNDASTTCGRTILIR